MVIIHVDGQSFGESVGKVCTFRVSTELPHLPYVLYTEQFVSVSVIHTKI